MLAIASHLIRVHLTWSLRGQAITDSNGGEGEGSGAERKGRGGGINPVDVAVTRSAYENS